MRKTLTAVALLLALSCTAFGGEIQIPPAPAPPSASATQEPTDDATLDGEMPTPGVTESLTQTVLELLAVLPSLL
jgi:hypothetical protein